MASLVASSRLGGRPTTNSWPIRARTAAMASSVIRPLRSSTVSVILTLCLPESRVLNVGRRPRRQCQRTQHLLYDTVCTPGNYPSAARNVNRRSARTAPDPDQRIPAWSPTRRESPSSRLQGLVHVAARELVLCRHGEHFFG